MAGQQFDLYQQPVIQVKVETTETEPQAIFGEQSGVQGTTETGLDQVKHGENETKLRLGLHVIDDHGYDTEERLTNQDVSGFPSQNDLTDAVGHGSIPDGSDGRVHVIPNYSTLTIPEDIVHLSLAEETVVETSAVNCEEFSLEALRIQGHQRRDTKQSRQTEKRKTSKTEQADVPPEEDFKDFTRTHNDARGNHDANCKGRRKRRSNEITRKKAASTSTGKRSGSAVFPCLQSSDDLSDDLVKIADCVQGKTPLRRSLRGSKKNEEALMLTGKADVKVDEREKTITQDKPSSSKVKHVPLKMLFSLRNKSQRRKPVVVEPVTSSKPMSRQQNLTRGRRSSEPEVDSSDAKPVSRAKRGGSQTVAIEKCSVKKCPPKKTRCKPNINPTKVSEETFFCPVCFKSFARKHHMKRHIASHSVVKPFSCSTCGKQFSRRPQLLVHEETHQEFREFEHQCLLCGKEFWKKVYLQRHMKTHSSERPFRCAVCKKDFILARELRNHARIHTGEKPYECKECGMTFTHNQGLLRHKRTHTGEKPYGCETCGKRFTENKGLIFHTRIHTGERPYVCEECGKGFPRLYALQKHTVKHTGVKAYQCPVCGKGFSQSANMKTHTKIHTNERRFVCPFCWKKFLRKSDLKKHLELHFRSKSNTKAKDGNNIILSLINPSASRSKRLSMKKKLIDNIVNGALGELWKGDVKRSPALMTALSSLSTPTDKYEGENSDEQSSSGEETSDDEDDNEEREESSEQSGNENDIKTTDEGNAFVIDSASCRLEVEPPALHSRKDSIVYPGYSREPAYHEDFEIGDLDMSTDPVPVNEVEVLTSPHIPLPTITSGNISDFAQDT